MQKMTIIVELLLELGGDLGIVNCVGNDFVAIAASMTDRGMWDEILEEPELLAKCGAKHAGRVALQLYAAWQMPTTWSSEYPHLTFATCIPCLPIMECESLAK